MFIWIAADRQAARPNSTVRIVRGERLTVPSFVAAARGWSLPAALAAGLHLAFELLLLLVHRLLHFLDFFLLRRNFLF